MTGHYCDFKNADVILTCGSNNLENHPVSSKWVQRALDKGATWIVVDPRFTRTAAQADIYCPIRSGTDIAFYGGLINYIIENDLWQHEYVLNYTNASYLINPDYNFDVSTGLFSGWDPTTKKYDTTTWGYQTESESTWDTSSTGTYSWVSQEGVPEFTPPTLKTPKKDPTLEDPNCVWQIMKNHYSRYTIDKVCEVCGMDPDTLELVYKTYASTGDPAKSGTILYALGQTQHHYGSENTRIMCMVQLLLGNAGMAGGGVNALRGEPNVQGATDMAMMVYDLPGYLHWPTVASTPTLRAWCEHETYSDGYYTNKPKFMVSFLKEWFGDNATVDNDYGYDWLPKVPKNGDDYTTIGTFELMNKDIMKGYFAWGQNPAASDPNTSFNRRAMAHLDWLVVADWAETATATFWKAPDMDASQINTEVYFLPAALIYEKSGTILNSGRWLQWRQKAVEPVDQAKPDYEMCDLLYRAIADLYRKEGGKCPEQILNTKWDYYVDGKIDPRPVSWALNGYNVEGTDFSKGKVSLLNGFANLKADGSTANGIWIYGGYYNNSDAPLDPAQQPVGRRGHDDPGNLGLYPKWAFSWPANRRIIYNRASADLQGQPWNEDKMLVKWDGSKWVTNDVPDFAANKTNADGTTEPIPPNNKAFFMKWEQNANLMTTGMKDAPLPEFYEPFESPVKNTLNGSQNSPMIKYAENESVKKGDASQYPIVATTYSITEHWQTGVQTRMCPALDEIAPQQFIEMSEELAAEKGIKNNDDVRVFNNRGSVKVKALVTKRIRPFTINGQTVHQIGMIHHWDWTNMFSTGDVVNDLTPNVGDPNSYIPEYKAFLVDVEKA
jgi:formate dehydrogenase major subunit